MRRRVRGKCRVPGKDGRAAAEARARSGRRCDGVTRGPCAPVGRRGWG